MARKSSAVRVVASDVCVCGGVQSLHLDEEVMTMAEEVLHHNVRADNGRVACV
jgi:hypothetical protein